VISCVAEQLSASQEELALHQVSFYRQLFEDLSQEASTQKMVTFVGKVSDDFNHRPFTVVTAQ
jgi:hypothetical protein